MNNQEYEQKKREYLLDFCKEHGFVETADVKGIFGYAFDRAYALGRETETITQEEIEKEAVEYVYERQKIRHYAKREEDASMRDFDKTIKAWDAYDTEQAFESGANLFLGKQEKDADTVIQGWVARDSDGDLFIYETEPKRDSGIGDGPDFWVAPPFAELDKAQFPDLTWESDPIEVELIIKRKKK